MICSSVELDSVVHQLAGTVRNKGERGGGGAGLSMQQGRRAGPCKEGANQSMP